MSRKAVSEDGGELVVAVKPGLHQHRAGNEGIQLAAQEYARVGLGDDRIGVKVGSIGERCLFGGRSGAAFERIYFSRGSDVDIYKGGKETVGRKVGSENIESYQ